MASTVVLRTDRDGLELRGLTSSDTDAYFELVDVNRAHLLQHGDYKFERDATYAQIAQHLSDPPEEATRFGIWCAGSLAGRVDLIRHTSQRYGIGYWLGAAYTGRGFATTAVSRAIEYAGETLGATDVFAGITHGNVASVALVTRLGFAGIVEFDAYDRYHLSLAER